MMIKVVIDTNVVVSADLVDEGPSAAMDLAARRRILMFVSPAVLAEYQEVLRRPRLKIAPARVAAALSVIRRTGKEVLPTVTLEISRDEADNRFYECAEAAGADYLITGNTAHFSKNHKGTKIITPREFLDLIVPSSPRAMADRIIPSYTGSSSLACSDWLLKSKYGNKPSRGMSIFPDMDQTTIGAIWRRLSGLLASSESSTEKRLPVGRPNRTRPRTGYFGQRAMVSA